MTPTPFKQWSYEAAARLGITQQALLSRIYTDRRRYPVVVRISPRNLIVVKEKPIGVWRPKIKAASRREYHRLWMRQWRRNKRRQKKP